MWGIKRADVISREVLLARVRELHRQLVRHGEGDGKNCTEELGFMKATANARNAWEITRGGTQRYVERFSVLQTRYIRETVWPNSLPKPKTNTTNEFTD